MASAQQRITRLAISIIPAFGLVTGCHSAFITAHVVNDTTTAVTQVELDYPSASFGKDVLAPGAAYDYRLKILGAGDTKLTWTDASGHEYTAKGPAFAEGAEGRLNVTIQRSAASQGSTASFQYVPTGSRN